MAGSRTRTGRTRAAIAATAAMAWFAPSYFLIGPVAAELTRESIPTAILLLTAWFSSSTLVLVLLRKFVRGQRFRRT